MIAVQDVCALLEDFAPLAYQEPYDNAGLIVGKRDMPLKGVLVCLDVSEPVIDEALKLGFNMIVSHHPLIFKGVKSITGNNHVNDCLVKAIKNDLAIYAGHTNVDSVINGVNGKMAEKLGLTNVSILALVNAASKPESQYGLGVVGELKSPVSEEKFLQLVKKTFCCKVLRHSAFTGQKVQRVGICGGSGSEFLNQAIGAGATVFLTGEAHYHDFFTEGLGIMLIDAGHYETEQYTKEVFFDLISKKMPKFAVRISTVEQNAVQYL